MTTQEIPYGYCHCGCGQQTKIASRSDSRKGWVKGQPMRFVYQHASTIKTPLEERFWPKVDKQDSDECWNWKGFLDRDGYGQISAGGVGSAMLKAHRYSYELHYGINPGDKVVLHICDNPSCVNPAHLRMGTPSDNMKDCWDKGRSALRPSMPGASHPLSTLTPEAAMQIRNAYETRDITQKELAEEFGVSKGNVYYVLTGKHWTVRGEPNLIVALGRHTKRWRMTKRNAVM